MAIGNGGDGVDGGGNVMEVSMELDQGFKGDEDGLKRISPNYGQ